MSRKPRKAETIECGDFVTVIGGERDGLVGVFEHEWVNEKGELVYVVLFDDNGEDFTYAPAISLYKKAD